EASVFEGMIEVKARIVAPGIVTDPFVIGVDVRRFGMSSLVGKRVCRRRRGRGTAGLFRSSGRGTVGRNVSAAHAFHGTLGSSAVFSTALSKGGKAAYRSDCYKDNGFLHVLLLESTLASAERIALIFLMT